MCEEYTEKTVQKCSDITNVNGRVCQEINLACYYNVDHNSCDNLKSTLNCESESLSYEGCMNIENDTCVWDGLKCKRFNVV